MMRGESLFDMYIKCVAKKIGKKKIKFLLFEKAPFSPPSCSPMSLHAMDLHGSSHTLSLSLSALPRSRASSPGTCTSPILPIHRRRFPTDSPVEAEAAAEGCRSAVLVTSRFQPVAPRFLLSVFVGRRAL